MENLKQSHEEFSELLNQVTTELTDLEQDVKQTTEEIKETVNKLDNLTEEEIYEKSVEELLGIEVIDKETRAITIDGEYIEYTTTETQYEKMTMDATEEEVIEAFNKYEIEKEIYKDLTHEQRIEIVNILREREALAIEYEQVQKEFQEAVEAINKDYNQAMLEGNIHEIVKVLKEKKELFLKYDKKSAAQKIDNLIEEVENSISLEIIKKSTAKIKNHKKIIDNYESGLKAAHKKFYTKLKKNRQSKFIYRENLEQELMTRFDLSEFNAKLFTYIFYGFAHNERIITRYSVLINEIIKNICTDTLKGEDKDKFKQSILEVNAIVCE